MKHKLDANISLTVVLVITTILILGGLTVLISSVDLAHSSKSANVKMLNELRSRSCVEEGLYRIKLNIMFTGQASIVFTDGNCVNNITIDPQNANIRIFTISSVINEYQFDIVKHIDITQHPYIIVD